MISKAQARQAFYKAAENIERNPELYDFKRVKVGEENCAACMWGHVGRALAMDSNLVIDEVCKSLGFTATNLYEPFWPDGFDDPDTNDKYMQGAYASAHAAARLRAFADKHFPESEEEFQPCGQSFQELIDSLNGIAA